MSHREHSVVIKAEGVTKEFSKWSQSQALNGVNLDVRAGEYIILFGPSGCGKSTFMNIMYGLEKPTVGRVLIRGKDLSTFAPDELAEFHQKKIGFVFQQFSFLRSLTVAENVFFPRMLVGASKESRKKRAQALLDMLGMGEFANKYPQELSGGQQQRVALARGLANNPWIMFFDEPTGALDKKSGDMIMKLIYDLNHKSHRTIVLVTHNPDYLYYAHRVIYMQDGTIVKEEVNRPLHFNHPLHHTHHYKIDRGHDVDMRFYHEIK